MFAAGWVAFQLVCCVLWWGEMPFIQIEKSISIFLISAKNVFEAKMECKLWAKMFPKPVKSLKYKY
jgi:hypothetical protein